LKDKTKIIVLLVILIALCLAFILPNLTAENYRFFLSQRVPKVAAIILTGFAIAFSSVLFQTVTNNRILTPATLGLDALYLLIQTATVFALGSASILVISKNVNFLFSAAIMIFLSIVLFRVMLNRNNPNLIYLILVGTIFGQLFRTLAYFLLMIISPSEFTSLQNKMFASFSNINTNIVWLAAGIFAVVLIYIFRDLKKFDVMALGRDHAVSLGIEHEKIVRKTFIVSAVLVSAATALVGPIAFLGLMVSNVARQMARTHRHAVIIALSVLSSAVFLLGGQLFIERVLSFDTTVTVVVNFVGGLYFIWLLLRETKI